MNPLSLKQIAQQNLGTYKTQTARLPLETVTNLANQSVELFFLYYQKTHAPLRESIALLCEMNASHLSSHVEIGIAALFGKLIEKLNDAFLPAYCDLYDRVFTQVISFLRQRPDGKWLDDALNEFKLFSEAAILRRKRTLRHRTIHLSPTRPLKKILLLSRITLGADVAITSVIIAALKATFPSAEIVLIGSSKLYQLYGGDGRIRIEAIKYGRFDNLLSRLSIWQQVVTLILNERVSLTTDEFVVIDPDSRLTQLGLLPIFTEEFESRCYLFFETRRYTNSDSHKIGQLTADWISQTCFSEKSFFPFLALPSPLPAQAKQVLYFLKDKRNLPVTTLSFGVGGNELKRANNQFENNLTLALSTNSTLIIDSGVSPQELEQTEKLFCFLKSAGRSIQVIEKIEELSSIQNNALDILVWRGDIGTFAALIANSDLYIGYDSSGQHIAAALTIPTLTLFINSGTHNFPRRWQPYGKGIIHTFYLPSPAAKNSQIEYISSIPEILQLKDQLLESNHRGATEPTISFE